ncbi:Tissue inhibitor of metalloproteinase, partial [Trichostrongylus colubriformis]
MKVFIALIACVVVSEACTCFPFPSLTDAFCYSSFVAHVRVTGRGENTGTRTVRYDVQILEAYRNQTESKQLPSVIVTASSSAACGLDLTTGTEYLIGGNISFDIYCH